MSTVTDLREKSKAEDAGSTMHEDSAHATTATIRKKPIIGILQVVAIIVLSGLAFFFSRAPDKTAAQLAAQQSAQVKPTVAGTQAPLVSILKPIASVQQVAITSTGSVAVRSYVTLTPQVSGKVVATSSALRSGGRFSAGETLVKLEQRDFTLALAQAQADVASAEASLQLSLAEGSAAVSNYRLINPVKTAPPLVAKAPQIAQARAQLQSAIARRDIQQTNLERSVFSLPFPGRVVESSADEGQILSVGQSFGRVYALDAVEIVITLAPEQLAKIDPAENRVVTITADGSTFEGRVDRVAAERDSRSRFSQVFITIDDSQSLTPGTFVSVTIDGPIMDDTFMLPESALQVGQVFWIVKDGNIAEVSANILSRSDEEYLVKAFDYDQGIIMGAVPGARPGLAVRLAGT
ncbi:MAG: RND family efflux transporter MFP subunit [Cyclobacteriaceae bacterium]|jgi:RND family efflux transporter MFP subunit